MKTIPFIENSKDNMHCVNAVFRMVHQYFFGKDLTFPPIKSRKITIEEFDRCFNFKGANGGITIFSKQYEKNEN